MAQCRKKIIGVFGGASADQDVLELSEELGRLIATSGHVLLTGGRPVGVMEAASRGAKQAGGLVVGVLPGSEPKDASNHVDIVIATGLSDARNLVNVLSCDVIIAVPGGAGTLSEVALALKNQRPVVLLGFDPGPAVLSAEKSGLLFRASSAQEALHLAIQILNTQTHGGFS